MKAFRILCVILLFVGITYIGIGPFAHYMMVPLTDPADFAFTDLPDSATVKSLIESADLAKGSELVTTHCIACHTIENQGVAMMDRAAMLSAFGLVPPDLSNLGSMLDDVFLFHFISNPVLVAKSATFGNMPGYEWLGAQELATIVAYLKSIAAPLDAIPGKTIAVTACARCHSIAYDQVPLDADKAALHAWAGAIPVDLSQVIKSQEGDYIERFLNDPQKMLPGTKMPRVGLTQEAQLKLQQYLDHVGDPKKAERQTIGFYVLLFCLVFTVFAWLWKRNEFMKVGK
jgi:ubiquinol-cytochrome c reductase cytochrome c1 subunit